MGKIVSSHGIKGWLKIYPFTENVATLNDYSDWLVSKDEKVWLRYKVEKTIIKNKMNKDSIELYPKVTNPKFS